MLNFAVYLVGKFHRKVMLADNGKDIHAGVVDMPQYFYNTPFRVAPVLTVICNFHYNLMPCDCACAVFFGDKNIARNFSVIRCHKAKAAPVPMAFLINADNARCAAFQYAYDYAVRLFSRLCFVQDLKKHTVLLHRAVCFACGDKDILVAFIGRDKTKAAVVAAECAGCHLQFPGCRKSAFFCFKNVPLCEKLVQQRVKFFFIFGWYGKHRPHFLALHWAVFFAFHISQYSFFSFLHQCCFFHSFLFSLFL